METARLIWIATWAVAKNYSSDNIRYCDYMYGHESQTDEVMDYVMELREIGRAAFYEKYKEYKLY